MREGAKILHVPYSTRAKHSSQLTATVCTHGTLLMVLVNYIVQVKQDKLQPRTVTLSCSDTLTTQYYTTCWTSPPV